MTDSTLAELRRDHETIEILARRLSHLIAAQAEPAELSTTLSHLIESVAGHLEREDAAIYALTMRAQPGIAEESVEEVQAAFERLKSDWSDYLSTWSAQEIERNREGFVKATRTMLPRLHNRLRLEEMLLVASALQRPADSPSR